MRNPIRAISLAPAILAVTLFCSVALPAFASGGDDKPVASSPTPTSIPVANTAAKPDREKKVFTNDDIDQMFPKQQVSVIETQTAEPRALTPQALRPPISAQRTVNASVSPEKDPVWYAQQIESLNSQLDSVSSKEASLREFRATGTAPDVTIGLQFGVEPEGFTTDNEVEQLAIRRQEIEQQIAALEDLAQQNGLPAGTLQNASEILQAAQKPLSPAQERAALVEKQDQLVSDLDDVHAELSYMSAQMAAQGGTLLPPTPGYGGNLTTNLITSLDNRSSEIKQAIDQNEDAARRAGLASSALP